MRHDSIGLFWQDVNTGLGRRSLTRSMPPIPDTGWLPPTEYPDLSGASVLSVDVETYDPEIDKFGPGWARGKGHIVGVSIGTGDGYRKYFPMRHEVEKEWNLDPEHVTAWLRHTLANPHQPKVGANIMYDIGWLRHEGIPIAGEYHDVQYAESLLTEQEPVALEHLAWKYLGEHKTSALLYEWCAQFYGGSETSDKQRANIYRTPPRLVGPYAESDADLPLRILERQWPIMAQEGLLPVYDMERGLIDLLVAMRFAGVTVDLNEAQRLRDMLVQQRDDELRTLQTQMGFEVNTNAPDSLARVFDALGLSYGRTKKTQRPSFTQSFLKAVDHPVGAAIRSIREKDKLIGTFVDGYIFNSNVNGKVYCQFHQMRGDEHGARGGRFASSDPNLQNLPIRTALGRQIRRGFIPDAGHLDWVKADYSQIEYRNLAHFAIGPMSDHVRELYAVDPRTDFHVMAQQLILQMTGQELERVNVKTINFALVYGMGIKALAAKLGLSIAAAKKLFDSYHKGAPFIKATMDATMNEAQNMGYVTTILGRRSRFDLWEPRGYHESKGKAVSWDVAVRTYPTVQRAYLHKALNRRLQGSAADLIKMAMLTCWRSGVYSYIGVPRLTVHDELDFSRADDYPQTRDAFAYAFHVMETAIPLRVPVKVDVKSGPNWGDVEAA